MKAFTLDVGQRFLLNQWNEFGRETQDRWGSLSPEGLAIQKFRHGNILGFCFSFPPAAAVMEVIYSLAMIGPVNPDDHSTVLNTTPYRYFLLRREAAEVSTMLEMVEGQFTVVGACVAYKPTDFIDAILDRFYGLTVTVGSGDAAMAAAIERARRELPGVLVRFLAGEFRDAFFSVKVEIKDGAAIEYFWLSEVTYADGQFHGIIDGTPECVTNVREGTRWSVPQSEVVDWMYSPDGKLYGNYTLRAALSAMPPEEAAKWRSVLSSDSSES